ncbi:hypothetical protein ACS25B_21855 [Dickeya dadantii subsp. dieffenbachiae]|uniref:hypothetical protein n=1 Tax=Dickeya dadantii TaxID=204038 RepID=UPI0012B5E6B4|nr:hypothetical protein [Dickeya dadantii]
MYKKQPQRALLSFVSTETLSCNRAFKSKVSKITELTGGGWQMQANNGKIKSAQVENQ